MTTVEAPMTVKYTPEFINCFLCGQSNNFEYRVVHEGSQYYLGTFCPKERCNHAEEFKEVPYRFAQEYLPPKLLS